MAKKSLLFLTFLLAFGTATVRAADSQPQAGTILHEDSKTPYASLVPIKNITDILSAPAPED